MIQATGDTCVMIHTTGDTGNMLQAPGNTGDMLQAPGNTGGLSDDCWKIISLFWFLMFFVQNLIFS